MKRDWERLAAANSTPATMEAATDNGEGRRIGFDDPESYVRSRARRVTGHRLAGSRVAL